LCHVLEVYIWIVISGLQGIGVRRGIDKSFAQVAPGVPNTESRARLERSRRDLQFPTWELRAHANRKNIDFVR
jgi:hypothetical protein